MKSNLFLVALASVVLAVAGCSSTPTKVNEGTVHARTFNFVVRPNRPVLPGTDNRAAIHSMVQSAITKNLNARGVSAVPAGGDVTVGYMIITGNNATTTSINDYFDYSGDVSALESKAHEAYTSTKNPNYFEAGTLLIDIVDSKTYKLLKRGYATRELLKSAPETTRVERLQEVVDEILRDVQIVP